jgi:hypothetical protein
MSTTTYPVVGPIPEPIFTSGQGRAFTIANIGTVTVTLSDTGGLGGWELHPGEGILWDAGKPLYVSAPAPGLLQLTTNAGTLFRSI